MPDTVILESDELVDRIKRLAGQKGISMEQEVGDLLQLGYGQRDEVLLSKNPVSRNLLKIHESS